MQAKLPRARGGELTHISPGPLFEEFTGSASLRVYCLSISLVNTMSHNMNIWFSWIILSLHSAQTLFRDGWLKSSWSSNVKLHGSKKSSLDRCTRCRQVKSAARVSSHREPVPRAPAGGVMMSSVTAIRLSNSAYRHRALLQGGIRRGKRDLETSNQTAELDKPVTVEQRPFRIGELARTSSADVGLRCFQAQPRYRKAVNSSSAN
ncbi:hypothetical protein CLCR_10702 [Cladophialophora carrionii]|uniref:Uncharacterized protein n=1 Tax=Cladophialophora carrionii TaxID=86049 RepID=A0A1C1CZ10_9EURO|nr:hypothetical protein CLCR_10702 [Cladophialophora carrionii]